MVGLLGLITAYNAYGDSQVTPDADLLDADQGAKLRDGSMLMSDGSIRRPS